MTSSVASSAESSSAPAMHYPWQDEQWQRVVQQFMTGRCPHALLLSGPDFVGKHQFSLAFAQLALCNAPEGSYACGACKACKLFVAGSHPDLLQLEPEDSGKAIKIDLIRQVNEFVSSTAQQGGWKVVILSPAEAMNVNSSNALLKSLEEPSAKTLLLLVSHQPSLLPATIRSRTRIVPFPVPSWQQGLSWLTQVITSDDADCKFLLEEAGNKPLLALKLLESDLLGQKNDFMDILDQVSKRELSPILAAERCFKFNGVEQIDWLIGRVIKLIKASMGVPSSKHWFVYMDRVVAAKRELQSSNNPNAQLLWESLIMDWQSVSTIGN